MKKGFKDTMDKLCKSIDRKISPITIQLPEFSYAELAAISAKCNSLILARKKIEQFIKDNNIDINDLLKIGTSKKTSKAAPKWRHKEDASLTWAGRGRMPKWIKKFGVKI